MLFKIYSGLADSCGVPQLAKKLNKVKNLQCWKHKLAFVTVSNVGLKCIFCILFFLEIPWKILPLQILIGFQYLKFKHVICLFTCISLQILAQHIPTLVSKQKLFVSKNAILSYLFIYFLVLIFQFFWKKRHDSFRQKITKV